MKKLKTVFPSQGFQIRSATCMSEPSGPETPWLWEDEKQTYRPTIIGFIRANVIVFINSADFPK